MNTSEHDPRRLHIVKGAILPDTAAILAALDADEYYDYHPDGDPPITTGQYRRITRAIANLATATPDQPLSDTPADAHTQGQIQILGEIRRIFAETVSLPACEQETPELTGKDPMNGKDPRRQAGRGRCLPHDRSGEHRCEPGQCPTASGSAGA